MGQIYCSSPLVRKRGVEEPPFFVSAFGFDLSSRHDWFRREVVRNNQGSTKSRSTPLPIHQSVPLACSHGKLLRISVGACFMVIRPERPPHPVLVLVLDFDGRHFLVVDKG